MKMIITSECENCIHSKLDESDKAKIKIYCAIKNKTYYFGQCVPCEYKEEIKSKDDF
jgi:hypothetical protein